MRNARDEFYDHVGDSTVLCAWVRSAHHGALDAPTVRLRLGYSEEEYQQFLDHLGSNYNNGFGGQELYGVIWFDDGSWSTRGKREGHDWWARSLLPEIPEYLK